MLTWHCHSLSLLISNLKKRLIFVSDFTIDVGGLGLNTEYSLAVLFHLIYLPVFFSLFPKSAELHPSNIKAAKQMNWFERVSYAFSEISLNVVHYNWFCNTFRRLSRDDKRFQLTILEQTRSPFNSNHAFTPFFVRLIISGSGPSQVLPVIFALIICHK